MLIGRSKARLISELTVDQDLDFLTLYQAKRLAGPASGEALRKGNKDITNAEVADAAAIAYSKLNLAGLIRNADIKSDAAIALSKIVSTYLLPTIMTTRGDMVYRGASYPGRIPAGTEGHVLVMGANDPGWAARAEGKTIATGSYTGDGTDDRQITVGFKCSMLIAWAAANSSFIVYPNQACIIGNGNDASAQVQLHATDGIVVDAIIANVNEAVYYYWAISE